MLDSYSYAKTINCTPPSLNIQSNLCTQSDQSTSKLINTLLLIKFNNNDNSLTKV